MANLLEQNERGVRPSTTACMADQDIEGILSAAISGYSKRNSTMAAASKHTKLQRTDKKKLWNLVQSVAWVTSRHSPFKTAQMI